MPPEITGIALLLLSETQCPLSKLKPASCPAPQPSEAGKLQFLTALREDGHVDTSTSVLCPSVWSHGQGSWSMAPVCVAWLLSSWRPSWWPTGLVRHHPSHDRQPQNTSSPQSAFSVKTQNISTALRPRVHCPSARSFLTLRTSEPLSN